MSYSGPDAGIVKQWESKVNRWVGQGRLRDQILMEMTDANWSYTEADVFLRRAVGRQKRKWIIAMIVSGLFTALGLVSIVLLLVNGQGDTFYLPLVAGFCFVYSIVKLVKIKA